MVANNVTRMISVFASTLLLAACARTSTTTGSIPEQGLTMSEIYHRSMGPSGSAPLRYKRPAVIQQRVHYQESNYRTPSPVNREFKALENPTIPIYIYPHVALIGDEQLIKPGFTTEFFLYKQNQFAMNSERY